MMTENYYRWFRNVINLCIALFFLFSLISNLCVYVSVFSGWMKYVILACLCCSFAFVVYLLKDFVAKLLKRIFIYLERFSFRKLLFLIVTSSIVLKLFYLVFFFFDSTKFGGDITIYAGIADDIVEHGFSSVMNQIYYLAGTGLHLSLFKILSLPYHTGVYLVFLLATIINFYSFTEIIGKEKSFVLIELYLLMPSTSLLTFCITHELFVYFYFSIILSILNLFLKQKERSRNILEALFLLLFISLNQTVSPIGKIWYIVLALIVLLSNTDKAKKALLVIVIVLSLLCTDFLSTRLEGNTMSQSNNYEQLLIGSNLESMGRHTDGRGKQAAKAYWEERGVKLTLDNLVEGEKGALIQQYKYLFTHPDKLFVLLANKFYVAWSGDYYSIEYAHNMGSINDLTFYIMLLMSAVIWLLVVTIGVVYYQKKNEEMGILNYKLIILGIMAVLLITEIMNKYSCYMTIFIYFVAFSRISLQENDTDEGRKTL